MLNGQKDKTVIVPIVADISGSKVSSTKRSIKLKLIDRLLQKPK